MASHKRRRLRQPNTDGNSYGNCNSYGNADSNGNTDSDVNSNSNSNCDGNSNSNGNGNCDRTAEVYAHATASADTAAACGQLLFR
jgi:hypothetical protein